MTAETELRLVGLSFCFCTVEEQNPTSTSLLMTDVSQAVFSLFFLLYYYYYLLFLITFFVFFISNPIALN